MNSGLSWPESGDDASNDSRRAMRVGKAAAAPLHGVRVIDLGQYIAGPGAAMALAELGADVGGVCGGPGEDEGSLEGCEDVVCQRVHVDVGW